MNNEAEMIKTKSLKTDTKVVITEKMMIAGMNAFGWTDSRFDPAPLSEKIARTYRAMVAAAATENSVDGL